MPEHRILMPTWEIIKLTKEPKLQNPILIEGLPGIGNVGKITADFLIEELKAKKLYSLFSYALPHSAFVNDDDLVELPRIEIYYKKMQRGPDILILTGDVQPTTEESCYSFCDAVIGIAKDFNVREIVTTAGIGLQDVPEKPKVYITGNEKSLISSYAKKTAAQTRVHEVVGPIVGVSGILVGVAQMRGLGAVTLLAETFGHPLYLGVKGAREILRVLNTKLGLKVDITKLTSEIDQLEQKTIKRTKELNAVKMNGSRSDMTYIG